MQLSKMIKVDQVVVPAGAATTTLTSDTVDMAGYDGCLFLTDMHVANSGNYISVQQSADDSSYAALAGTKVVCGAADQVLGVDVYRPIDRYLQCVMVRGGSSTASGSIIAIQYCGQKFPIDNAATTTGDVQIETYASPAEGSI